MARAKKPTGRQGGRTTGKHAVVEAPPAGRAAKKPTGKHDIVAPEPSTTQAATAVLRPAKKTGKHDVEAPASAATQVATSALRPPAKQPRAPAKQTGKHAVEAPASAATQVATGVLRPPAKQTGKHAVEAPASAATQVATGVLRPPAKQTGKHVVEAPASAATQVATGALRPPAKQPSAAKRRTGEQAPIEKPVTQVEDDLGAAKPQKLPDPVAPTFKETLIGPQAMKQPARTTPPPVPRPAPKRAQPLTVDPAQLRSALDAVLAAPDDRAARIAYADMLRSAGDPRGDFIAVGFELANHDNRSEREDPSTKALWDVFRELHTRHGAKWTKPLKALGKPTRWRWHRGFVHELRINGWDAGCTPANLAAVLALEPVTELAIEGGEPDLIAQLLAIPGIERVRRLAVSGWNAQEGGVFVGKLLGKAKRLANVLELRAGLKLGDAGVKALLDAESLDAVVHLALGAAETSTKTFAKLAASPMGQRLEVLEWLRDTIEVDMAKVAVTMPSLHTFVASTGYVDTSRDILAARFRERFVIEDEPGTQYLIDGIRGVTHRPVPKR